MSDFSVELDNRVLDVELTTHLLVFQLNAVQVGSRSLLSFNGIIGTTILFDLLVTHADGVTPLPLAGDTLQLLVKRSSLTGTTVLTKTSPSADIDLSLGASGLVSFRLNTLDTASYSPGTVLFCYFNLIDPANNLFTLAQCALSLFP